MNVEVSGTKLQSQVWEVCTSKTVTVQMHFLSLSTLSSFPHSYFSPSILVYTVCNMFLLHPISTLSCTTVPSSSILYLISELTSTQPLLIYLLSPFYTHAPNNLLLPPFSPPSFLLSVFHYSYSAPPN